jgi:hypothetical protein
MKTQDKRKLEKAMIKDYQSTASECGRFSKCGKWRWMGCFYYRRLEVKGEVHTAMVYWWGQYVTFVGPHIEQRGNFNIGKMQIALNAIDNVFTYAVLKLWEQPKPQSPLTV